MSIHRKMLLLLGGFLLITLVLTFGSYSLTGRTIRARMEKTVLAVMNEKGVALSRYFSKLTSMVALLAETLPSLQNDGTPENYRNLFSRYLQHALSGDVQNVFMGFEDGQFIDATGWTVPPGYDLKKRNWYSEAVSKGKAILTAPYKDLITGDPIISVVAPVFTAGGELMGVAGFDVNITAITESFSKQNFFGVELPFLVDREGHFIAGALPGWTLPESILNPSADVSPELAAAGSALLSGEKGPIPLPFQGDGATLYASPAGETLLMGILLPDSLPRAFIRDISLLHLFGGFTTILLALVLLVPVVFEISRSFSSLSATLDRLRAKIPAVWDLGEASDSVQAIAIEIGEAMESTRVPEFRRLIASMESTLHTIARQGERISALTEEGEMTRRDLCETNEELTKRQQIWKNTLEVVEAMATPGEVEKKLPLIVESIRKSTGAFGVLISHPSSGILEIVASCGYDGLDLTEFQTPLQGTVAGKAFEEGQALWIEDVSQEREYLEVHPLIVTEVEIPLFHLGNPKGVLEVAFDRRVPRNDDLLETLLPVASALAGLLEVEDAHGEIKRSYRYLAEKLQSVTEIYHFETADHMDRIGAYSRLIARGLGRSAEEQEDIAIFSRLHDIGKLRVPLEILAKSGPLTEEERGTVQIHSLWGAELMGGGEWLDMARSICLTHHEKWDGSGYPVGLAGEAIPWEGQVVALADVYDALRSHRVYKEAMTHKEAARIILEGDGRTEPAHFSPEVLKVFRRYSDEMNDIFEEYGT
ncbi:MAG: HD domain-containing protein [Synergistaceae bacterium]|nr:HD domain-containing protein [Synergistaceae bacterium]